MLLNKTIKKPELKFIPGLVLIGPQTTQPWRVVLSWPVFKLIMKMYCEVLFGYG